MKNVCFTFNYSYSYKICCRKYHKKKINYKYSKYKKILLKNIKKKHQICSFGFKPHCETTDNFSEEEKVIVPAIKHLKKKV